MTTMQGARSRRSVKPGPRCSVCTHPKRGEIDRALVEGASPAKIAARYRKFSDDTIRRHADGHLPARLAQAAEVRETTDASETLQLLHRCLERVNLLFDACDRWLRDPDDPSRYDIGPRASDVRVTYEAKGDDGKPVRKKASLSELLERLEGIAPEVRMVETKHADPRELLLQTARRLEGHADLMGRLLGELKEAPTVNIILSPEWSALRRVILAALEPYPEARQAVALAVGAHAGG
jgi:hypothetical protein